MENITNASITVRTVLKTALKTSLKLSGGFKQDVPLQMVAFLEQCEKFQVDCVVGNAEVKIPDSLEWSSCILKGKKCLSRLSCTILKLVFFTVSL